MKLLSKLLILSLCASFGVAECGFLQRFSALSRSWMPKGIAATVVSYWFMKPAVVKAQNAQRKAYFDDIENRSKTYFDDLEKRLLFCKLCNKDDYSDILLENGRLTSCSCLQSFEAARVGYRQRLNKMDEDLDYWRLGFDERDPIKDRMNKLHQMIYSMRKNSYVPCDPYKSPKEFITIDHHPNVVTDFGETVESVELVRNKLTRDAYAGSKMLLAEKAFDEVDALRRYTHSITKEARFAHEQADILKKKAENLAEEKNSLFGLLEAEKARKKV